MLLEMAFRFVFLCTIYLSLKIFYALNKLTIS